VYYSRISSRCVLTYPASVTFGTSIHSPTQHVPSIVPWVVLQSWPVGIQSDRESGRAEAEACMANVAKTRSMGDLKNCIVGRFGVKIGQ
jgi:hypothetical protein